MSLSTVEQLKDLRTYVAYNITESKDSPFHTENFANLVGGYIGSKGEFSEDDINYLHENGFSEDEFMDEETDF